jgi:transposase InsO family protein
MSERRACQLVKQPRGTQRYQPTQRDDEDALTRAIIALASQYGRYGYRRITVELQAAGWRVSKDRVERIWRREGLKVPQKQRRFMRAAAARAAQSRLVLRFRKHVYP